MEEAGKLDMFAEIRVLQQVGGSNSIWSAAVVGALSCARPGDLNNNYAC